MNNNDGGILSGNRFAEIDYIMKELESKRREYNEMKRDDTFHIDVYEQTEILLLLLNGLYAVYNQGREIIGRIDHDPRAEKK